MTSYTTIPDATLAANKPLPQAVSRALRDNPIAITEGSAGAPKNTIASISPSAIVRRAIITNGAGVSVWGTLADMIRANVSNLNSGGAISNLAAAGTSITTVDLGTVVAGDIILASGFFEYSGSVNGEVEARIIKDSGTATVTMLATSASLRGSTVQIAGGAGNAAVNGIINVTGSGTLVLQLSGRDSLETADVAQNFGQLQALVLVGG